MTCFYKELFLEATGDVDVFQVIVLFTKSNDES